MELLAGPYDAEISVKFHSSQKTDTGTVYSWNNLYHAYKDVKRTSIAIKSMLRLPLRSCSLKFHGKFSVKVNCNPIADIWNMTFQRFQYITAIPNQ